MKDIKFQMWCRRCQTLSMIRYTADKRSEDKARQALLDAGWIWVDPHVFPVHAQCPTVVS